MCFFAGIDAETIGTAVKAFPGVEHRIEFCGNMNGVDFYNDSKGTNVDASVIAIKALRDFESQKKRRLNPTFRARNIGLDESKMSCWTESDD